MSDSAADSSASNTAIIWRELLCADAAKAREFYGTVFGWQFIGEQADDFTWGDGAGVYGLITTEAGIQGGLTQVDSNYRTGWMSYVRVHSVDATSDRAERIGGRVIRAPFDVPGVGRNALLATPGGAIFGVSEPSYPDRAPASAFLSDTVLVRNPDEFGRFLIGLGFEGLIGSGSARVFELGASGDTADIWLTTLRVSGADDTLAAASRHGASQVSGSRVSDSLILLRDPLGSLFAIAEG